MTQTKKESPIRFIIKQGADGLYHLKSRVIEFNHLGDKIIKFELLAKFESVEAAIDGLQLSLNAPPRYWDKDGKEIDREGEPVSTKGDNISKKKGKK